MQRCSCWREQHDWGEPCIMSVHCLPVWSHITRLVWASITGFKWNWPPFPPLPILFAPFLFLFFETFLIIFCITETYIHMHAYMQTRSYMQRKHAHTHRFMKTFVKTEFIFYVHSHRPICVDILFHSWYQQFYLCNFQKCHNHTVTVDHKIKTVGKSGYFTEIDALNNHIQNLLVRLPLHHHPHPPLNPTPTPQKYLFHSEDRRLCNMSPPHMNPSFLFRVLKKL